LNIGLLCPLTNGIRTLLYLYQKCYNFHQYHYNRLEQKILESEEYERYRIKKSILLYHSYLIIVFYLVIPILNPFASFTKSLIHITSAVCQIFILKGKNQKLIGSYVYIHGLISLLSQYLTEGESLTIIGLVLANQHMFFLFPEGRALSKIYIPIIILVVRSMQSQLLKSINFCDHNLEYSLRSLAYSWPAIYIFHHLGAQNLTTSYRVALIGKINVQKELKATLGLLEKTNKDLQEAAQSRELFIASVSHELRNPLNCLIGNIELLRLEIKNEKWLTALESCKISSEVLLGHINNVLDVAKINAEKLEIHFVPGNFYRLVEKVWKISAMTLKQKNLKGEVRIAHRFPKFIEMDSHRLTQILLNLIGNASKFALEGFVHVIITWHEEKSSMSELIEPSQDFKLLTSKRKRTLLNKSVATTFETISGPKLTDAPSIEFANENEKSQAIDDFLHREFCPKFLDQVVSSGFIQSSVEDTALERKTEKRFQSCRSKEKGIIKIEVVDSGCGMSPEALKGLFQPFKQADASITRQFGGTGLGLYITKQIIQKMGGEIYVQSKEGVGSSFTVLLPATTASQEDVEEENVTEAQNEGEMNSEKPIRALIVDDIQVNQLILSSYLKKMNIESDVANNGLDAVNIFKAKGPNYYSFITMDLQMPVMDGLTASAEIRKYEKILGVKEIVPIIVVTGNCTDTEKTMCLDPEGNIRAHNFFRKPFTFGECKSTIQALLAEAQSTTIKKPLRILIVDDDALSGQVSKEHFTKSGFICTPCNSGKEALNMMYKENFELILINCDMLDIDGYVTAKHIRSLRPSAFIIGITGQRREECLKKSQENGMSEIQTKPVDYRKLSMLMKKKLSESN